MPTLLQINAVCNSGSTGRIAEEIGLLAIQKGWKSHIAYGRGTPSSVSNVFRIGANWELYLNAFVARIWDNDGFCRKKSTKKLIEYIKEINPDIVHLHNLHGYYLNIEILMNFLNKSHIPIVWTLHDCWAFTGHCVHFDFVQCKRWKEECFGCVEKGTYPKSLIFDRSRRNFQSKKFLFSSSEPLTISTPSQWLADLVKQSFLKNYTVKVIPNGINRDVFFKRPTHDISEKYRIGNKKVVLGVAGNWDERKGLSFFISLSKQIDKEHQIIVLGLTKTQICTLPKSIIALEHTESINELAEFYSLADVYVNPTLEDNFPTTNLEALSCGTPVATFRTGGSAESIGFDESCGIVVEPTDVLALNNAINKIISNGKQHYTQACIKRVDELYDAQKGFEKYFNIYSALLTK